MARVPSRPTEGNQGSAHAPFGPEVTALVQATAKQRWNLSRLSAVMGRRGRRFDFATAGVSGQDPEGLLERARLPAFSVGIVVDIRATPTSRHIPQWNRTSLETVARSQGIEYVHRPDLGVPSEIRERARREEWSYGDLFAWYDRNVLREERLDSLSEHRAQRPLFLCTELGPTYCHRHRLALALETRWHVTSFDL